MAPRTFGLLLFAILLLFGIVKAGVYKELENGNKYYVQISPDLKWYDAKKLCADHNMTLITLDTEELQMDVVTIFDKFHFNLYVWSSAKSEGDLNFVWTTTGNYLNYTNWGTNEPYRDGVSDPQCLAIASDDTHYWHSIDCYKRLGVICDSPLNKEKQKFLQIKAKNRDLEIELNETKHENEELQMKIQEISKNQSLAIEFLVNKKNLEIDNIKKDFNETKGENEDLQMQIQEISKNQSMAVEFLANKKNREIENIKKFCNKQIDSLINEITSLKQSSAIPSIQTANIKSYYMQFYANKN